MLELNPIHYYWAVAIVWHTFKLFDNIIRTKSFGKYACETANQPELKGRFTFKNRVVLYSATGLFVNFVLLLTFWRCYCSAQLPFDFVAHIQKYVLSSNIKIAPEMILLGLVLHSIHLSCRIYESIFNSVHSWRESFNIVYVAIFFLNEIVVVFSLAAEAPDFSTYKDCFQLKNVKYINLVGLIIFYFAIKIRRESFNHFKSLRKNKAGHIVTTAYKQPVGSFFKSLDVSNPHHFAELLVYFSLAVVLGVDARTWLMVCFKVAIQLVDRSISAHNFYRSKFDDYPKDRRILIPYLL